MGEYEVEITQEPSGYWIGNVFYVKDGDREAIGETKRKDKRNDAVAEAGRIAKFHKGPEIEKLDV
jgi:hypothetical protein